MVDYSGQIARSVRWLRIVEMRRSRLTQGGPARLASRDNSAYHCLLNRKRSNVAEIGPDHSI